MVIFLLCLHTVGAAREFSGVCLMTLIPFMKAPWSWPNDLPKAPASNTIPLGVRISTYEVYTQTQKPAHAGTHTLRGRWPVPSLENITHFSRNTDISDIRASWGNWPTRLLSARSSQSSNSTQVLGSSNTFLVPHTYIVINQRLPNIWKEISR